MSLWSSLNELKGEVVGKVSQTVSTIAQEFKDSAADLGYTQVSSNNKKDESNHKDYEYDKYGGHSQSMNALKAKLVAEKSRSQQQHNQLNSRYEVGGNVSRQQTYQRYSVSGEGFRKRGASEEFREPTTTAYNHYESSASGLPSTFQQFSQQIMETVSPSPPQSHSKRQHSPSYTYVPHENSQNFSSSNTNEELKALQQQFQKAKNELVRLSQEHQDEIQMIEQENDQKIHNLQSQSQKLKSETSKLKQEIVDLKKSKQVVESMANDLEQRLLQQTQNDQLSGDLKQQLDMERKQHEETKRKLQQLSAQVEANNSESQQIAMQDEVEQRMLQQLSDLKKELAKYQTRGVQAEEQLKKERTQQSKIVEDYAALQQNMLELQKEVDLYQEERISRDVVSQNQLESTQKRLDNTLQEMQKLQLLVSQMEIARDELEQQLESRYSDQLTMEQELTSLQSQLQEREFQLKAGEAKVETLIQERDQLLLDLDREKAGQGESQMEAQHELSNVQDQLDDLREQYQQVVNDWQTLLDEKEKTDFHFKVGLTQKDDLISKLRKNLEDTDKELNSVMVENVQLQEKLASVQNELKQESMEVQGKEDVLKLQEESQNKIKALEMDIEMLRKEVVKADEEKEKARSQLSKLKNQLIQRQESEEEASSWRVKQEVSQAVESVKSEYQIQIVELQNQLAEAQQLVRLKSTDQKESGEELHNLRSTLAARNMELQNLQIALGELSYESEAAEKLRHELFTTQSVQRTLESECKSLRSRLEDTEQRLQEADKIANDATQSSRTSAAQVQQLSKECQHLRRALEESSKRINAINSSQGAMVDRRIVAKLLTTYFERKQGREIMELMSKMLDFNDDQRKRVGLDKRGIFSSIFGGNQVERTQSDSFADQWADFLLQQTMGEQLSQGSKEPSQGGQPSQAQQQTQERSYSEMVAAELHRSQMQQPVVVMNHNVTSTNE